MLHVLSGKLQQMLVYAVSDCALSDCAVVYCAVADFAVADFAVADCAPADFAVSDCTVADFASRQQQIPAVNACESLRSVFTLQDAISNKEKTPRNAQYITFPVFSQ